MVELSEKKRTEYEQQQPIFWRKARDSASVQKPYFEHLLTLDSTIVLVYECEGTIQGFVIASLHTAPPVYDPGGLTCNIDDFVVEDRSLWKSVGRALLDRATIEARVRKVVQVVVVTGGHDLPETRDALFDGSFLSLRVVGKRYIESRARALKYTRTTSSDLVIRMCQYTTSGPTIRCGRGECSAGACPPQGSGRGVGEPTRQFAVPNHSSGFSYLGVPAPAGMSDWYED